FTLSSPTGIHTFPYTTLFRSWEPRRIPRPIYCRLAEAGDRRHRRAVQRVGRGLAGGSGALLPVAQIKSATCRCVLMTAIGETLRSEEHTSELQSRFDLVCRLL